MPYRIKHLAVYGITSIEKWNKFYKWHMETYGVRWFMETPDITYKENLEKWHMETYDMMSEELWEKWRKEKRT